MKVLGETQLITWIDSSLYWERPLRREPQRLPGSIPWKPSLVLHCKKCCDALFVQFTTFLNTSQGKPKVPAVMTF